MKLFAALMLAVLGQDQLCAAFQQPLRPSFAAIRHTALLAKSRKTKRKAKQSIKRNGRLVEAMTDVDDSNAKTKQGGGDDDDDDDDELEKNNPPMSERERYLMEAEQQIARRPEVTTTITDEESGVETIVQGRYVMDVVTRKAVKLSDLGPEYRLAQMFPGVPPDIRQKYRFDWNTCEVPEMLEKLREACYIKREDGTVGLPPFPSVANKAIDFMLANRDLLGHHMSSVLHRLTLRSMWKGNKQEALDYRDLASHYILLDRHISAPFRQIIQDAEGRTGPNFGNLDLLSFSNGELYERVANYIVLKGMVAHWEQKVVDADFVERVPDEEELSIETLITGNPKRYLSNSPILYTLSDCTKVCAMAQQMCKKFVETEELYADFPPEIVFLEDALKIKGGTALREYMVNEFCPQRDITPEGLREGMRRFLQQMKCLQTDPYGDLTRKVEQLCIAMAVGSDDSRYPYAEYLINIDPDGPAYFQTYTFNHEELSMVRFLDSFYPSQANKDLTSGSGAQEEFEDPFGISDLVKSLQPEKPLRPQPDMRKEEPDYEPPEERALGRPHNLGWLELLDDVKTLKMKDIPPGRIIYEDE